MAAFMNIISIVLCLVLMTWFTLAFWNGNNIACIIALAAFLLPLSVLIQAAHRCEVCNDVTTCVLRDNAVNEGKIDE